MNPIAQELARKDIPLSPHSPTLRSNTKSETARVESKTSFLKRRLHSLDAYRGLIMITLAFVGFGLAATSQNYLRFNERAAGVSALALLGTPHSQAALLAASSVASSRPADPIWQNVFFHFEHAEWVGGGYWDMIQPSFMFMVGAAMAFSYTRRRELGESFGRMLLHAMSRSLILIFLGIFLISNGQRTTQWSLMNVLTQIGLGYTFLFLLWGRSLRTQALAAAAILLSTWLLYELYPHSGINLESGNASVGISKEWAQKHLADVRPAWHKSANVGQAVDLWLVNQLPLTEPYRFNRGGYQTINFIPSLATMLFGLMCGELLRSQGPANRKLLILLAAGVGGIVAGQVLHMTGICPLVKRIWTPSWALYSTGWCCLILGSLYGIVDMLGFRWWTFPLVVVGVNSIAIYSMSMTMKGWTARTLQTHLGPDVFQMFGPMLAPTTQAVMVGLVFWLICLWMYRQKIFIRI